MKTNDILLLMLPDDMQPLAFREELCALDSTLRVVLDHEPHDPAEVGFIVGWKRPEDGWDKYPNLRAVHSFGAGVDQLLKGGGWPEALPLARVVDEKMAVQMSEYILTAVLLFKRHFLEYAHARGGWNWGDEWPLTGNRVGILGMGHLGQATAALLQKIGFEVHGWGRSEKVRGGFPCFCGRDGLGDFLRQSDYLVAILPNTPDTIGLLNHDRLQQLPSGAVLINVGRGAVLVEDDLLTLLDEGHLVGACLDVFQTEPLPSEHPFVNHPKVLVTPHVASLTPTGSVAPTILENYQRALQGRPLLNQVDPAVGY